MIVALVAVIAAFTVPTPPAEPASFAEGPDDVFEPLFADPTIQTTPPPPPPPAPPPPVEPPTPDVPEPPARAGFALTPLGAVGIALGGVGLAASIGLAPAVGDVGVVQRERDQPRVARGGPALP